MKTLGFFATAAAVALLGAAPDSRAEAPRGDVVELHSCELFTGGCTASAQATLEGRWMLRGWNFAAGTFDGVDLAGLSVVMLESADENLAMEGSPADRAVIYVPSRASGAQRAAVAKWAKANALARAVVAVRPVALDVRRVDGQMRLRAGKDVALDTGALEACASGSCGESLWYSPRSATSTFEVALNTGAAVAEPLLELKWRSNGTRSVFIGTFGDSNAKLATAAHAH